MAEFPATRYSLIARVQSPENREAWEDFVLAYRPVIYRMARRRGLQDADAQDLTQAVLMRIAGAIDRWEPTDSGVRFRHWLSRVAKNAIINAITRSPQDAAAGGTAAQDLLAQQTEPDSDLEAELARERMREQYLRAAAVVRNDVNPETWLAFELSVIEGESCEKVSQLIGKSVGTVYAARSRVMRRLRDEVQQLEQYES